MKICHVRTRIMNAPKRRTTFLRLDRKLENITVTLLVCAAFLAPLLHSGSARAAGLYEDLLKSCTSQVGSMPLHVRFPRGRYRGVVHPHYDLPASSGAEACSDFTWTKLSGRVSSASIAWRGRTTTNAADCNHSTMSWGMYKKGSTNTWSWVGGGSSYGNMPGGDGGTCNYDMTGAPVGNNWGSFTATTGSQADAEYRIAFFTWSHEMSQDECADAHHCNWPINVSLGGAFSPLAQDQVIWRPSTGTWWVKDSASGTSFTQQWGLNGDSIVPGDFDGDALTDFAVTRNESNKRVWYVINSSTGASFSKTFGNGTDIALTNADFDGDGRADVASFRSSNGGWNGVYSRSNVSWAATLGQNGDIPVVGLYDDDLKTDRAVWRPSNGTWLIKESFTKNTTTVQWGLTGDIPVAGDFDGDFKTDLAVWRPSNGKFYWIDSADGQTWSRTWGLNGDIPIPSYFDGDLKSDFAVFRPSEGRWYVVNSNTGSTTSFLWGQNGDLPAIPFVR